MGWGGHVANEDDDILGIGTAALNLRQFTKKQGRSKRQRLVQGCGGKAVVGAPVRDGSSQGRFKRRACFQEVDR